MESTHPAVPSPPHANIRILGTVSEELQPENSKKCNLYVNRKLTWTDVCYTCICYSVVHLYGNVGHKQCMPYTNSHPNFGPPWLKSNIWRGFSNPCKICSSLNPWFPPLLGFMKTKIGLLWLTVKGFTCEHNTNHGLQ